jgi:hypothetical protein
MTYIPIYLDDLFSVENILQSRGFKVLSTGSNYNLILKGMKLPRNQIGLKGRNYDTELVYRVFNSRSMRHELLSFIEYNSEINSTDVRKLIENQSFQNSRQAFSTTFEWYIGELMVRDYSAMSSSHSVKITDIKRDSDSQGTAGDFDVLSILRNLGIAYFECKTGRFNRDKILKAVERSLALHCSFVIMCIDGEIQENKLKQSLKDVSFPLTIWNSLKKISIKNSDISVYNWMNCYFISTYGDVDQQINTVLRFNSAKKIIDNFMSESNSETYDRMGYQSEEILINKC